MAVQAPRVLDDLARLGEQRGRARGRVANAGEGARRAQARGRLGEGGAGGETDEQRRDSERRCWPHDVLVPAAARRANGKRRTRWPERWNKALATAGAMGGTPGSPTPVGASPEGRICTSTAGMSWMRSGR